MFDVFECSWFVRPKRVLGKLELSSGFEKQDLTKS